jgi:hypothetical protein
VSSLLVVDFRHRVREVVAVMRKDRASAKKAHSGEGVEGNHANEPQSMPIELAGRWVAWSADGLRIIGSGKTLEEAEAAASAAGEPDPIFEVAPGGSGGDVHSEES